MNALTRFVAAGLCLASIILLTLATLFEPKSDIATSTFLAWAAASCALTALGWLSIKGMFKALQDAQELSASVLFERQIQPKNARGQELLYARKLLGLSQRYSRPLSVVGISWAAPRAQSTHDHDLRRGFEQHLARFRFLKALDQQLRSSDAIVPSNDPERCFVVCPETSLEQAAGFCRRVELIISSISRDTVLAFSVATLEADGYALEDLLEKCDRRLNKAPLLTTDRPRHGAVEVAGVAAE